MTSPLPYWFTKQWIGGHVCVQKNPVGIVLFSHFKIFFYSKEFAKLLTTWLKTIYNWGLKKVPLSDGASPYRLLHYEFMSHFSSDIFKFRVNWRHNLLLFAPSRLTTYCLTLENNKKSGGGTKISSLRVGTQLYKLKTFYKQAMLSDDWAKGTILNFILFINISFMEGLNGVNR